MATNISQIHDAVKCCIEKDCGNCYIKSVIAKPYCATVLLKKVDSVLSSLDKCDTNSSEVNT